MLACRPRSVADEFTYRKWNNVKGSDIRTAQKRDELLSRLQDFGHSNPNLCRRNVHSLSEAHDLEPITAINEALKEAIKAVPETFSAVTWSAERFASSRSCVKPYQSGSIESRPTFLSFLICETVSEVWFEPPRIRSVRWKNAKVVTCQSSHTSCVPERASFCCS